MPPPEILPMEPQPLPASPTIPTPSPDPITRLIADRRFAVGIGLVTVTIILLILGIVFFVNSNSNDYDSKRDKTAQKSEDPTLIGLDTAAATGTSDTNDPGWAKFATGLAAMFAAIGLAACGTWLLTQPLPSTNALKFTEARTIILGAGGFLGFAIFILGIVLFRGWFDIFYDVLSSAKTANEVPMWKPLSALLLAVLGLGIAFLAVQPARADERNSPTIRRLVYAVNLLMTIVLVLIGLVLVNVVTSLKLPNRLDTSERGFYTLEAPTSEYLASLKKDIDIYLIAPEEGTRFTDVARLLSAFREANPSRVHVKSVSPTLDKTEIERLAKKYSQFTKTEFGVIVAATDDEKQHTFIRGAELFAQEPQSDRTSRLVMKAEGRIIREILFFTEATGKPVIYFTQGSGEISIEPQQGELNPTSRPGDALKNALIKDGCEVRPLRIDPLATNPKVPDDASVVVIADPTTAFPAATVNALRAYMAPPAAPADKKRGKLIVMAGAHRNPVDAKTILKPGFEPVLAELGVLIQPSVFYAQATDRTLPNTHFMRIPESLAQRRNPIALTYLEDAFRAANIRPISLLPSQQPSQYKPFPLLFTFENRLPWEETELPTNPRQAQAEFVAGLQAKRPDVRAKVYRDAQSGEILSAITAAIVSETVEGETVGRAVVFGFSDNFVNREARSADEANIDVGLFSASINWLRDRPAVANIASKEYGVYRPNPRMSWNNVFWIPVGATMMLIVASGLGVWALRRK